MLQKAINSLKMAVGVTGLMWLVFLANFVLPIDLRQFGICPRQLTSLAFIAFMPFLHSNLAHIVANTSILFFLLVISFVYDEALSILALAIITVIGGVGVWIFGSPNSCHIGASGLVFGLIGYLMLLGIYHRRFTAILVSVVVLILYGGILIQLLMVTPDVSWAGHFFGFVGGVLAAKWSK